MTVSGCSGGDNSTLVEALRQRGHAVVDEPGRRIVREGGPMPWDDPVGFARRAIEVALADREVAAARASWVFFDRGVVDAASWLEALTGEPAVERLGRAHRFYPVVLMAPPWEALFATDDERRHGFAEAVAEHERLLVDYARLGYETLQLPRVSVAARVDVVLNALGLGVASVPAGRRLCRTGCPGLRSSSARSASDEPPGA